MQNTIDYSYRFVANYAKQRTILSLTLAVFLLQLEYFPGTLLESFLVALCQCMKSWLVFFTMHHFFGLLILFVVIALCALSSKVYVRQLHDSFGLIHILLAPIPVMILIMPIYNKI